MRRVLGIDGAVVLLLAGLFVQSLRAKWGPAQRAVRRFNRDVTNPRQLETAGRPGAYAAVVHHGERATGSATVEHEGRSVPVQQPRLDPPEEADRFFPPREQRMHRVFGVVDFLHVTAAGR